MMKRYPGLRAFTEQESILFFGRDKEIEALKKRINSEQITTLYGKSGAGKTSLLRAGLTPALKNDEKHVLYVDLSIKQADQFGTPGINIPLQLIQKEAERHCNQNNYVVDSIIENESSLWYTFKKLQQSIDHNKNIVILIDHIEDLFMFSERTIDRFKQQLSELLQTNIPQRFRDVIKKKYDENAFLKDEDIKHIYEKPKISVLIAVKSNKLSILNKLGDYIANILSNCYELQFMTTTQANDALLYPAMLSTSKLQEAFKQIVSPSFSIKEEALNEILSFLSKNNQQPIAPYQLQIAGQFIEKKITSGKLKTFNIEHNPELKDAIDNFYMHTIEMLASKEEKRNARKLIENQLVFDTEKVRVPIYEGVLLRKYNKELLNKLIDLQLLEVGVNYYGDKYYEISSDTLINQISKARDEFRAKRFKVEKERMRRIFIMAATPLIIILAVLLFFVISQNSELQMKEKRSALEKVVMRVENSIYKNYLNVTTPHLTTKEKQLFININQSDIDSLFHNGQYREAVLFTENAINMYKEMYFSPLMLSNEYAKLSYYLLHAGQLKKSYNFSKRAYRLDSTQVQTLKNYIISSIAYGKTEKGKQLYQQLKDSLTNDALQKAIANEVQELKQRNILPPEFFETMSSL